MSSALVAEHPSGEEDCVLAAAYHCTWKNRGDVRYMSVPAGFRFFPGVQKMPLVAKLFLRLIGITKMLHSALPHDALYASKGGRRPEAGVIIRDDVGTPLWISRKEADLVAFHFARAENVRPYFARIVKFAVRQFGASAWDD